MDPEFSCLIAGSRDDTTFGIVADGYGLATKFRIVALFYSSEELVHINMNNLHSFKFGLRSRLIFQPIAAMKSVMSGLMMLKKQYGR